MQTFEDGIRILEKIDPDHPLLPRIRRGDTPYNRIYLKNALAKYNLEELLHRNDPDDDEMDKILDSTEQDDDPVIRQKHQAMASLYSKMARYSNEFHVCKNNDERSTVSRKIERVMNSIKEIKQELRYYYLHGSEKVADEKYPVPDDKVSALRRIYSIRASVSRWKRFIREESKKEKPNGEKILKTEQKIKEYEIHAAHIQKAYKDI